jgi:hypothetical protein
MCATKVGKFKETFSPRSKSSTVDFKFSYIIDDLIGCSSFQIFYFVANPCRTIDMVSFWMHKLSKSIISALFSNISEENTQSR